MHSKVAKALFMVFLSRTDRRNGRDQNGNPLIAEVAGQNNVGFERVRPEF